MADNEVENKSSNPQADTLSTNNSTSTVYSKKSVVAFLDDESDEESESDDDEQYLEEEEPWGTTLMPSPNPYDLPKRVEELNRQLSKEPIVETHIATKVTIHEEFNEYFSYEDLRNLFTKPRKSESTISIAANSFPTLEKNAEETKNEPNKSSGKINKREIQSN